MAIIPVNPIPSDRRLYTNITPFTVRDNATYLIVLEEMRRYINGVLIPFINDNVGGLDEEWRNEVDRLIESWEQQSADLIAQVNAIAEQLGSSVEDAQAARDAAEAAAALAEQFASDVVAFQDSAITEIFNDVSSDFRIALNSVLNDYIVEDENDPGTFIVDTTNVSPYKIVGIDEDGEFPERVETRLDGLFGDSAIANRILDPESVTSQSLEQLYASVITPTRFGAAGDGVTDDTAAWNEWKNTPGVHAVLPGSYLVDDEVIVFDNGQFGGGENKTNLTPEQQAQVGTRPERIRPDDATIFISTEHGGPDIMPALYVISLIDDNSDAPFDTKNAGIHSYMEQTGEASNQYVKAITGVSVNAVSGDNDSTGVVGYSYKLNVPGGVGDAAGAGGAAWQYSTEEGLVLGGEFAAHQNVAGTSSSPNATNGNNSMSLHITTNSAGDKVWSAIGIDGQSAATTGLNRHGYWNVITIGRSCFASNGASAVGTVGINFGNNTTTYPEKAFYLGNAVYHFWRNNGATRMRTSSLDIDNANGAVGVRLFTTTNNPQSRYIAGYRGNTGPDGETTQRTDGSITFASSGYVNLTAHDTSGNAMSVVELSPATPSLLPPSSGNMGLGASSRRWSQLYAVSGTINTSDEREKTEIGDIPDLALDAWAEVGFSQFKMRDAVAVKGGEARLHSGVIAQRVLEAFAKRGLDANDYGLMCFDKWDETPENIEVTKTIKQHAIYEQVLVSEAVQDENGNEIKAPVYDDGRMISPDVYEETRTVTPGIPAGERYGIRYEEALCFEAAYQRRRADRLESRIDRLEKMMSV